MSVEQVPEELPDAAQLFKLLGSETRLRLLALIDRSPCTVGHLAERAGISQPLVSQHLRALRDAGLISATRSGREMRYAVVDHHVTHVVRDALDHVRESITRPGDADGKETP